mmetsp:Transcript_10422/g.13837  ORF Transcript_10422/g.13837 Transcript_10422/m.13837 type:complete len:390 (+) Transcript_10422:1-1170(+)
MQAALTDSMAQLTGCRGLQALADTQREGPGPWGGRRVSTALLVEGIGEAMAQGLLNAVAIDAAEGRARPGLASSTCLGALNGLTVQNDYSKGLALINGAPHLWTAIVAYFRAFKDSPEARMGLCTFAGLFGTPQPAQAAAGEVEAGGIDFVLAEFLNNESLRYDPEMFQRVFCALSDPVHEQSGVVARAIAHHGGRLQGVPLMVHALRMARESGSTFHEGNGFGLLYEGVHDVGGVLEHDDSNKTFATAFVQAGLVHELVPIMRMEPADNLLQDMSCEVVKWITDGNAAVQDQLAAEGAMEVMAEALKRFTHPPRHGYGMVVGTCSAALLNFARSRAAWRDRLLSLGVSDTLGLTVLKQFPVWGADDFTVRAKAFPNTNIYELKMVLER